MAAVVAATSSSNTDSNDSVASGPSPPTTSDESRNVTRHHHGPQQHDGGGSSSNNATMGGSSSGDSNKGGGGGIGGGGTDDNEEAVAAVDAAEMTRAYLDAIKSGGEGAIIAPCRARGMSKNHNAKVRFDFIHSLSLCLLRMLIYILTLLCSLWFVRYISDCILCLTQGNETWW